MSATGPDPTLVDPTPRHLRITLSLGALMSIVAGLLALARSSGGRWMDDRTVADLSLLALILLGLAAGMAIVLALVVRVSARRTARIYARLQAGDALADWRFEPTEWADWLAAERRRATFPTIPFLACAGVVVGVVALAAYPTWMHASVSDRMNIAFVAAGPIAVIGAVFGLGRWASRRKASTMRGRPRVIVLDDAIYCGGVLYRWGEQMIVLRSIKAVPGTPTMLEATIGKSAGLRAASTAVGVAGLLAGRGTGTVPDTTFRLPVPAGRLDEAKRVMRRLLSSDP